MTMSPQSKMFDSCVEEFLNDCVLTLILIFHLPYIDTVSQNTPRVIDDSRARKLAADLKRCPYYETCAMYGLNVDRVFQDGEFRINDISFATSQS